MTGSINIWYPHTHNAGDIFSEMIAFEWIILRRVLYSTNSPLYNTHWSHVDKRMKECDSMEYFPELISVFRSLWMRGTVGWGGNLVSQQPHGSGFASGSTFLICSINHSIFSQILNMSHTICRQSKQEGLVLVKQGPASQVKANLRSPRRAGQQPAWTAN